MERLIIFRINFSIEILETNYDPEFPLFPHNPIFIMVYVVTSIIWINYMILSL